MYSVVLMAALATGGSTPAWGGHGCCGCCGGWSSCYGCYGSCFGSCYGCWGSCYGCYGCWGCYGGGWGTCYGCHGCYGCYGCYGSCWGCYGCYGCYGSYPVITNYGAPLVAPAGGVPVDDRAVPNNDKGKKGAVSAPVRAHLVVQLPADAKLYIDDHLMKTTSAKRVFNTPVLNPGQVYYYILRTEVVRDGKTLSDSKRVLVRAGEEVHASFGEPTKEYVAAKRDQ